MDSPADAQRPTGQAFVTAACGGEAWQEEWGTNSGVFWGHFLKAGFSNMFNGAVLRFFQFSIFFWGVSQLNLLVSFCSCGLMCECETDKFLISSMGLY